MHVTYKRRARFKPKYKAKLFKRIIQLEREKIPTAKIAAILNKEGFRTALDYHCDTTFVQNCRAQIRMLEKLGRLKEVLKAK